MTGAERGPSSVEVFARSVVKGVGFKMTMVAGQVAGWVARQRYRFRVVQGEHQIEKNSKGTPAVQLMLEVTTGPQVGQRMRYRGYLNSPENAKTTIAEMRVMGWRGIKLGDWSGITSKEFEATATCETGADNKTYWRAAWPRAVAKVNAERAVKDADLSELNEQLGGIITSAGDVRLPPPPTPADEGEEQAEIPF